jgi:hypothetical protein
MELKKATCSYVIIDGRGVVRYATNDYMKMERCLIALFSDNERERAALFVPLVSKWNKESEAHLGVDFTTDKIHTFLKSKRFARTRKRKAGSSRRLQSQTASIVKMKTLIFHVRNVYIADMEIIGRNRSVGSLGGTIFPRRDVQAKRR